MEGAQPLCILAPLLSTLSLTLQTTLPGTTRRYLACGVLCLITRLPALNIWVGLYTPTQSYCLSAAPPDAEMVISPQAGGWSGEILR